jgi:hypothetical protein
VLYITCIALRLPLNGLVVHMGMAMTEEGKEKKVNIGCFSAT